MRVVLVILAVVASNFAIAGGSHNASVFCDRVTASGRGMNCSAMVFAHRTLPLGSTHRMACNGRVITAKVIDRGPYVRGRSFDLSPALARACGIDGLGHVSLI